MCLQPNEGEDDCCVRCECPRRATLKEKVWHRQHYAGPLFDADAQQSEAELEDDAVPREAELDKADQTVLMAAAGALAGAVMVIAGGVAARKPIEIETVFYGALIMGLFLPIRMIWMGPGSLAYTRRSLLVIVAVLCCITFALAAVSAGWR